MCLPECGHLPVCVLSAVVCGCLCVCFMDTEVVMAVPSGSSRRKNQ